MREVANECVNETDCDERNGECDCDQEAFFAGSNARYARGEYTQDSNHEEVDDKEDNNGRFGFWANRNSPCRSAICLETAASDTESKTSQREKRN